MTPEKLRDNIRKLQFSFHLHLAVASYILILIFNYLFSDHFDHPFMTFTFKKLRTCEKHCSLQTKTLHWPKTVTTHLQLAIPEFTRFTRNPENRFDLFDKDLHQNTLVPVSLRSNGQPRNSENHTHTDSIIVNYLDSSR